MGKEVFNRYEKKFIINNKTYNALMELFGKCMKLDEYNQNNGFYTICNIYYDTISNDLIKKSVSKPIYKEKLRLRTYGVPEGNTKGYLEIKKKYNGIVNKRRTSMGIQEAYDFLSSKCLPKLQPYHNSQVINEIEFFINRYELKPTTYIAYDRKAMFNEDLRITFDTNIRTRRYDLVLELGDHGEPLLQNDQWLMEIKVEKAFPIWLTKALSELKIYPTSFSKYGCEYLNTVRDENISKGDHVTCLNPYLVLQQVPRFH